MNCRDSPNIGSPICPGGRFSVQSLPEFCFIILYKSTPTTKIKTNSNIFFSICVPKRRLFFGWMYWKWRVEARDSYSIPPYYEDEHVTSEGNGRDVIAVYAYRFKYQSIFDRGYWNIGKAGGFWIVPLGRCSISASGTIQGFFLTVNFIVVIDK